MAERRYLVTLSWRPKFSMAISGAGIVITDQVTLYPLENGFTLTESIVTQLIATCIRVALPNPSHIKALALAYYSFVVAMINAIMCMRSIQQGQLILR